MRCLSKHLPFYPIFSSVRYASTPAAPVVLRPYQEHCLDACIDALATGSTRIGVSLPTGSGKTTVFISLLSRMAPPTTSATRSLIVVNSIELARQSADQVARLFPNWLVEIEQGMKYNASGLADVTVATYQTLIRGNRWRKFDPATMKAIIVDEAHHAAAPSYRRLLAQFHNGIKHPDSAFQVPVLPHKIPIIGFSATFSRHDGLALGSVFERIVYHRDFLEMIKEQWLCNVRFTSVRASINLKDVTINTRTGDFNPTSLAHVINTDTINDLVVKTWIDRAATRKSTLIFCVNIAHVHALTQHFRKYGIDARYVYSETPVTERKALVAAFRAGQFPVLINCAILTEGADIPNIDCVIVARPTRSRNVFAQMIGRGMRLSPDTGKADCRIIDFVDSTTRVAGVVSIPTLFGLDPSELAINDETTEFLEKRAADIFVPHEDPDIIPAPKTVTYIDYENPFSLVKDTSGAPHIATLSKNAWVGCGEDVYVLECLAKGYVRIEPVEADDDVESHFAAFFTPAMLDKHTAEAMNVIPYMRSRKVLTARTVEDAVRGCDTYVASKIVPGPMAMGLLRSARWRKAPASKGQLQLLAKRWARKSVQGDDGDQEEKLAKMTKGDAANIIIRLKHGAQARFEKKMKLATRAAAVSSKEAQRRAREDVRVGPLHLGG
ncbi:P-loop containing nucleoside triphosphate hydrolase protein [Crucibulum laeve]|uniref:P-loop containing nucleoside triphosphate hydrolase protein n=1 Tax=Crucibulum laeve TaxID=68775 RepID=A0A5C3M6Y5_9AGAR|nr:P-loop containing nucleoside triphosphate hydrolase protein [Crucibulum laeve]